jgi:hypothetical protein
MRHAIALLFVLQTIIAFTPALAEQPIDPEKRALIEKLMVTTGAKGLALQVADAVTTQFWAVIRKANPKTPKQAQAIIREEVMAMLEANLDNVMEDSVHIYARHFTKPELQDIIAFHATATGRKLIATTPLILQESMAATQQRLGPLMIELQERIATRLKDAGYL